jgi:hypothetical protein
MRAQDLAAYFSKKVAKPIAYSYRKPEPGWSADRNYVVEPIAVEDSVLHVLVTLKSQTGEGGRIKLSKQPVVCGEVQIPLEDGDSVLMVMAMAVAEADFGQDCVWFPESDLMRVAYEDLHGRQAYSEMRRIGII